MKNLRNQPEDWSFLIYVRENDYGKKECQELIKFTTESTMTKRKGKDMEKWMKCYVGTELLERIERYLHIGDKYSKWGNEGKFQQ